jgi:hypothetical protein
MSPGPSPGARRTNSTHHRTKKGFWQMVSFRRVNTLLAVALAADSGVVDSITLLLAAAVLILVSVVALVVVRGLSGRKPPKRRQRKVAALSPERLVHGVRRGS